MKKVGLIVLASLLLFALLLVMVFERKDVRKARRGNSYSIERTDLGGLKLFNGMLQEYFGHENVRYEKDSDFLYLENSENTLLIVIYEEIAVDTVQLSQLSDFIDRGNEVLLISNYFDMMGFADLTTRLLPDARDSVFQFVWEDQDTMTYVPYIGFNDIYYHSSIYSIRRDSTRFKSILETENGYPLFGEVEMNDQKFYLHSAPILFQNRSSQSTSYNVNFSKTFQFFESDSVVLHKLEYLFGDRNDSLQDESVLQYILGQRALKYAYYLTWLLGILYVFFAAKRKQREIPIREESKNTSLDYIETTSDLFMAQNQNEKLVKHLRTNFFYKVKTAYFLHADDPQFEEKLAKKSKYPIEEIRTILKQLALVEAHSFNDDQLNRLFNDINSFDKNRK